MPDFTIPLFIIALLALVQPSGGATVSLAWDAVPRATMYRVEYTSATVPKRAGEFLTTNTQITVSVPFVGKYVFAVSAHNANKTSRSPAATIEVTLPIIKYSVVTYFSAWGVRPKQAVATNSFWITELEPGVFSTQVTRQ